MTFQFTDFPTVHHWWHDVVTNLEPIYVSLKKSSAGLTQSEITEHLDKIHEAYVVAHIAEMPIQVKAQMVAAICNLQMSFCARYEGQQRESSKLHRIAQVEWVLLQEMLQREGIDCKVIH